MSTRGGRHAHNPHWPSWWPSSAALDLLESIAELPAEQRWRMQPVRSALLRPDVDPIGTVAEILADRPDLISLFRLTHRDDGRGLCAACTLLAGIATSAPCPIAELAETAERARARGPRPRR